ncbi:CDP-glycerol glycerophosphotransferase family protein [Enterobacteriaceae bacterium H11S18]|uniref:CDP-glycerol glycerophosphotransferase family protein n=1 Tax=Dryocola clanedunensis TaxID=2925396 RepID=UPI0022F0C97F|nr:CDP-glycerol glycerophosphotransferase family protein [Dryocola clanedunensis]MCT4712312.1 CDP-glycerol glycerophosphotransferase family protein [Dryocola clanedunensis]
MIITRKAFTFVKVILGRILYLFSGLISRDNSIWVFGSFGVFNDNSRYLFEHCQLREDIFPVWISKNKKSVKEASMYGRAYYAFSIKGLYYSIVGGVYIYSSYLSDINFYTSNGAFKVNLWHGVPLKKIEFDINSFPLVKKFKDANIITRFINGSQHTRPDLLLSPSKFVTEYSFSKAFRVPNSAIVHARYPRVGALIKSTPLTFDRKYKKIFLYAPTWRDDGGDFINASGIDFADLNRFLYENNSLLMLKLHSSTKLNIDLNFDNIMVISNQVDPNLLLFSSSCLITDYSSIYFDYLYLDRPIIFFCFDKENYLINREMYFEYDEYTPGEQAYKYSDLKAAMNNIILGVDDHAYERDLCVSEFALENNDDDYICNAIQRVNRA